MGREHLMIKQDALKYQYYGKDIPEVLFDLDNDPSESKNVIDEPQYAQDKIKFQTRLAELGHGPNANSQYKNAGY